MLTFNDASSTVLGFVTAISLAEVAKRLNLGEERYVEGKVNPDCGQFDIPETNSHSDSEDCLWIHSVEEIESATDLREILENDR